MAVIKYKDNEGNFHKVSIGGGSGTDEVYIGSSEPPVGAKVWIDPTGTPSQPSQPSAGVEVIDNLESDSTTAALSANQGRVLKEMIGNAGGGGGGNSDVYFLPSAIYGASMTNPCIFSTEEAMAFREAISTPHTRFLLSAEVDGGIMTATLYTHMAAGGQCFLNGEFCIPNITDNYLFVNKIAIMIFDDGDSIMGAMFKFSQKING